MCDNKNDPESFLAQFVIERMHTQKRIRFIWTRILHGETKRKNWRKKELDKEEIVLKYTMKQQNETTHIIIFNCLFRVIKSQSMKVWIQMLNAYNAYTWAIMSVIKLKLKVMGKIHEFYLLFYRYAFIWPEKLQFHTANRINLRTFTYMHRRFINIKAISNVECNYLNSNFLPCDLIRSLYYFIPFDWSTHCSTLTIDLLQNRTQHSSWYQYVLVNIIIIIIIYV